MKFPAPASRLLLLAALFVTGAGAPQASAAPPVAGPGHQPHQDSFIRTPPPPATPRINGPRIFGARPGSPFLFQIPATGELPLRFSASGLPVGLTLDPDTGRITGVTWERGAYPVVLGAKNAAGDASTTLQIVIGDRLALTPPMGWNNYNAFRMRIDDALIRAQADAMVGSGLARHGWTYLNIDDGWQGRRDEAGNIQGNKKFPDMKALGEHIHGLGLKFGLYSSPGPRTCAGYEGTFGHEARDVRTYAEWGVDYLKYDWCFYDSISQNLLGELYAALLPAQADRIRAIVAEKIPLTEIRPRKKESNERINALTAELDEILKALPPGQREEIVRDILIEPYRHFGTLLQAANRDIVYSLCQYGMGEVWEWGPDTGAQLWRTTRDITPEWGKFQNIIRRQAGLEAFAGPGRWNDPDMLEIGNGKLTPDEMHMQMTQWCILAAPLLIGTDLTKMTPLVLSILTNDEVIAVNQDALGRQGVRVHQAGDAEVYVKSLVGGRRAVALFNRGEQPLEIRFAPADLKLAGPLRVRDLWRQRDLPGAETEIVATVAPHGAELYSVGPAADGGE